MTSNCDTSKKCVAITPLVSKSFSQYIDEFQIDCDLLNITWPTSSSRMRSLLRRIPFFRKVTHSSMPLDRRVAGLVIDWSIQTDSVLHLLDAFPELRWLHVVKTGIDHLPKNELLNRKIQVTSSKGAYSKAVAEFAMGLIYLCAKKYLDHQADPSRSLPLWSQSLRGQNALILGTGHIGTDVAALVVGNGLIPLGVNSDGRPVPGFARTCSWNSATELAAASAFIIDCLPLTPRTLHIVGNDFLSSLPQGACYINVGRIETVDLAALFAALHSGRLAHAVLDTEAENIRIPKGLRSKLLVTHHSAYATDASKLELARLFMHNIHAFATDTPFRGKVDLEKGY